MDQTFKFFLLEKDIEFPSEEAEFKNEKLFFKGKPVTSERVRFS
jgi:hypothetical protein